MIFALIGDVLPKEVKDEINGIVVTSRREFNTLQIWIKNFNRDNNDNIESCIRDLLQIPPEVNLEFRQFFKNNKNNWNEKNKEKNNKYNKYIYTYYLYIIIKII